jgi:hypothetical protein
MSLFFEKYIDCSINPKLKIYNKRVEIPNLNILKRIDLTYQSSELYQKAKYPYLENVKTLKQILPVPGFLLNPLLKYKLPYETNTSGIIKFRGQRTVIYLHGVGGISEENSILQRQLIENGCDLIRVSYGVDYEREGISYPKKTEDMLPFIREFEMKISPILLEELKQVLTKLKKDHPDLIEGKEIILIAHSLGAGILANIGAGFKEIEFSKFINLDGTLMNPAITTGLNISQLHLSQDSLFQVDWIDEEASTEPLKSIGQDYCKRINTLINQSKGKSTWIQIQDTTHFSFTDFSDLLKQNKLFKQITGNRESAKRIRSYVNEFILQSDVMEVNAKDKLIRIES